MQLKRIYRPDSLSPWQKRRDEFLKANIAEAIEKNNDQSARGIVERKSSAQLRRELADRFISQNSLPPIQHIEVEQHPRNGIWNISKKLLEEGMADGWLSIQDGKVVIRTADGEPDVEYQILRRPGHYCCYCGEKLQNSKSAPEHIAQHEGEAYAKRDPDGSLPDDFDPTDQFTRDQLNNPSGWGLFNEFRCERIV